jgi:hypothetical protein
MDRRYFCAVIAAFLWFLLPTRVISQSNSNGYARPDSLADGKAKVLRAIRIQPDEIRIDGVLDDPAWQRAPAADQFVQNEPVDGAPATERTAVQVAYDDRAIYVAVRAEEAHPELIRGLLTRRDEDSPSDWIYIGFDTDLDRRTAYLFAVNAAGVKQDAYWSNDTNSDPNWDAVWDVAIRVDSLGWSAEFAIPFSQLRFPTSTKMTWGFQVARQISHLNEVDFWSPVPRDAAQMVSLFGLLEGLEGIPSPRRLQVVPYSVTSANYLPIEEGNPFRSGPNYRLSGGVDVKYSPTSNLTVDATLNPDFGQVEADPSVLNLTAFETFFEEKRPFFIEGSNIFRFGIGVGDGEMGSESLFYSRRIGRSPQIYPSVPGGAYTDRPTFTTILGAAKLSGRTASGWSVGILEAVTAKEYEAVDLSGQRWKEPIEPAANYAVARLRKDLNEGRTTFGAIVTNTYRDVSHANFSKLHRAAWSGGLDFSHRWRNNTYFLQAKLAGSYVTGEKEALQRTQTSPVHYFQRPDAGHLRYDPNRTSLSGFGGSFMFGKMSGGHWRFGLGGVTRSPGFEVNDLGFLRQADYAVGFMWIGYREYKPGPVLRDYGINFNAWGGWTYGGESIAKGGNINVNFRLLNYWSGGFGVNWELEGLSTSMLRGGPGVLRPGRINTWFYLSSDSRKPFQLNLNGGFTRNDPGFWQYRIQPGFTLRPTSQLKFSLSAGIMPGTDDLQYVSTVEDEAGTHYVLGRLKRTTVFFTTRLNYTLTPNLSVQFYGMPFLSAGRYLSFKEVIAPRAERYEDRFQPFAYDSSPDFNFKQFRSNLVIRWEYDPGSVVFLVWSQERTDFVSDGSFRFGRDFGRLFDAEANNVFLVKVTRWLSM